MRLFEIVLIALGMACDIFARVICESSSYASIDKKKLLTHGSIFGLWELVSLTLGHYTVRLLEYTGVIDKGSDTLQFCSVLIVFVLAVRMIVAGIKQVNVVEHRTEKVELPDMLKKTVSIGLRTYLVGFAFAACQTPFIEELAILTITSIIVCICGLYVGYRYGFGLRNKVYLLGAVLFIGTDIFAFCNFFIA